jgi:hypothetical protein
MTELANEVAVCTTCHALIHAGLLRVTGSAGDELHWTPVAIDRSPTLELASDRSHADRLPVVQFAVNGAGQQYRVGPGDSHPGLPQNRTCPIRASGSSSHGLATR